MAFFSGTDSNTIRAEGNDTNCFVSLVVDTKGTYVAALTRKVKEKKQVTTADLGSSYEFFGEGSVSLVDVQHKTSTVEVVDREVIEYFMLDVQIEPVDNPLAYLDTRFDEIEAKKKKMVPTVNASNSNKSPWIPGNKKVYGNDFDDDYSFRDWQNSKRKEAAEAKEALLVQEQTLFPKEEMDAMVDSHAWEPDPTIIHKLICQMVTCSLLIKEDIDIEKWINRWSEEKYDTIFGEADSAQFRDWYDFIIDFMLYQYESEDTDIPTKISEDWDLLRDKVATAMYNELQQYTPNGENLYIDYYKKALMRYKYE